VHLKIIRTQIIRIELVDIRVPTYPGYYLDQRIGGLEKMMELLGGSINDQSFSSNHLGNCLYREGRDDRMTGMGQGIALMEDRMLLDFADPGHLIVSVIVCTGRAGM
jgi:hypothetical protein